MNKKIIFLIVVVAALILIIKMTNNKNQENMAGAVSVGPISHASMILNWGGMVIYTDPVDEAKTNIFAGKPDADVILLTDIHGDHLNVETLEALSKEKTLIIAPMAVADMLPASIAGTLLVMNNGQKTKERGFNLEAIPMYNLPESDKSYHTKGRGNGYVIEKGDTRVYISGDTSGIPEMRSLRDIDMAFVAINLPYTMGVEEAADAVLEFKPKKVYPYHYRERMNNGFADVAKFKEIVNSKNPEIEVVQLDWYPKP